MPAPSSPRAVLALALSALSLAVPALAAGQQRGVLFGLVVDDSDDAPIVGAEVELVGSDIKVKADDLGMFVLADLAVGVHNLRIEKPGYSKVVDQVEIPAAGLADLEVRLVPMAIALRELLVTGQRMRKTGYSVTELKTDGNADATAADLLAANVPGVRMSVDRGVAGTSAEVSMRGINSFTARRSPAIYLDGILISEYVTPSSPRGVNALSVLAQIPASQVQRIFVLRGPATNAQYPQADGVIVIETVRGQPR